MKSEATPKRCCYKHKASERSSGAPRNQEAHNSSVIENGVAPEATPASNESQLRY
jgi:hypothetical protein